MFIHFSADFMNEHFIDMFVYISKFYAENEDFISFKKIKFPLYYFLDLFFLSKIESVKVLNPKAQILVMIIFYAKLVYS